MSEVRQYCAEAELRRALKHGAAEQGNLAHKKLPPPRTLQQAYAQCPTVVLWEGQFLMSEAPLLCCQ